MMIVALGLLAGNRNTNGSFNNLTTNGNFWTSLQSGANAWNRNLNSGNATVNRNTNDKLNGFSVRCLKDWKKKSCHDFPSHRMTLTNSLSVCEKELKVSDLFQAYYDARRHKRRSTGALLFEMNYESELFKLYDELKSGRYRIGPSACFISFKPVKREIFAAGFRDRIVHHVIYNFISPTFERLFISDSYSCRVGKGTSYGIRRVDHFIRSCSENYSRDCYVLQLDIKGYFMSMDRSLLFDKVEKVVRRYRERVDIDVDFLLPLIRQVIFHDSTKNCRMRGKREDWAGLPKSKSLFFAGTDKGLPIGNLTSQLFGNVYLNDFDHFIKCTLGCRYYGRYVDDMVIVHRDKEFLKTIIPVIRTYLRDELALDLHPKKLYLQHVNKGVPFLGTVIKPYRIYIGNRTKGNFFRSIKRWNALLENSSGEPSKNDMKRFLSSVNSYLGFLKNYRTYTLRRKILTECLAPGWREYIHIAPTYDTMSK